MATPLAPPAPSASRGHAQNGHAGALGVLGVAACGAAVVGRRRVTRHAAEMAKLPKHMQPVDTKQGPRGMELVCSHLEAVAKVRLSLIL